MSFYEPRENELAVFLIYLVFCLSCFRTAYVNFKDYQTRFIRRSYDYIIFVTYSH